MPRKTEAEKEANRQFWADATDRWVERTYSNVSEEVINFGKCYKKIRATLACSVIHCDCGGTMDIEVCNQLPQHSWQIRRHTIKRPCPGRLERKRASGREAARRWRAENPELAAERNRRDVAAWRSRQKG